MFFVFLLLLVLHFGKAEFEEGIGVSVFIDKPSCFGRPDLMMFFKYLRCHCNNEFLRQFVFPESPPSACFWFVSVDYSKSKYKYSGRAVEVFRFENSCDFQKIDQTTKQDLKATRTYVREIGNCLHEIDGVLLFADEDFEIWEETRLIRIPEKEVSVESQFYSTSDCSGEMISITYYSNNQLNYLRNNFGYEDMNMSTCSDSGIDGSVLSLFSEETYGELFGDSKQRIILYTSIVIIVKVALSFTLKLLGTELLRYIKSGKKVVKDPMMKGKWKTFFYDICCCRCCTDLCKECSWNCFLKFTVYFLGLILWSLFFAFIWIIIGIGVTLFYVGYFWMTGTTKGGEVLLNMTRFKHKYASSIVLCELLTLGFGMVCNVTFNICGGDVYENVSVLGNIGNMEVKHATLGGNVTVVNNNNDIKTDDSSTDIMDSTDSSNMISSTVEPSIKSRSSSSTRNRNRNRKKKKKKKKVKRSSWLWNSRRPRKLNKKRRRREVVKISDEELALMELDSQLTSETTDLDSMESDLLDDLTSAEYGEGVKTEHESEEEEEEEDIGLKYCPCLKVFCGQRCQRAFSCFYLWLCCLVVVLLFGGIIVSTTGIYVTDQQFS